MPEYTDEQIKQAREIIAEAKKAADAPEKKPEMAKTAGGGDHEESRFEKMAKTAADMTQEERDAMRRAMDDADKKARKAADHDDDDNKMTAARRAGDSDDMERRVAALTASVARLEARSDIKAMVKEAVEARVGIAPSGASGSLPHATPASKAGNDQYKLEGLYR